MLAALVPILTFLKAFAPIVGMIWGKLQADAQRREGMTLETGAVAQATVNVQQAMADAVAAGPADQAALVDRIKSGIWP